MPSLGKITAIEAPASPRSGKTRLLGATFSQPRGSHVAQQWLPNAKTSRTRTHYFHTEEGGPGRGGLHGTRPHAQYHPSPRARVFILPSMAKAAS
eukprot:1188507-Prorocentrum_minimum.AAC.3